MGYALLADLLVGLHLLIVVFVVGGLAAVLVGAVRGWWWVRNAVFRVVHLLTIAVIALDSTLGVLCPLTEWEYQLRRAAGQSVEEDISFVGRLVRATLYYDLPEMVFTAAYVGFALLVVATLLLVPPRWRRQRR